MFELLIYKGLKRKSDIFLFDSMIELENFIDNNYNDKYDYWISKKDSGIAIEYRDYLSF